MSVRKSGNLYVFVSLSETKWNFVCFCDFECVTKLNFVCFCDFECETKWNFVWFCEYECETKWNCPICSGKQFEVWWLLKVFKNILYVFVSLSISKNLKFCETKWNVVFFQSMSVRQSGILYIFVSLSETRWNLVCFWGSECETKWNLETFWGFCGKCGGI